jgi:hypothetical protein
MSDKVLKQKDKEIIVVEEAGAIEKMAEGPRACRGAVHQRGEPLVRRGWGDRNNKLTERESKQDV